MDSQGWSAAEPLVSGNPMIPAPDGADACATYTVVRIVPPPLSGRE
jgi:hypothetical protein